MTSEKELPAISTQRAGRREWIGLAVIALPCMVYSMDLTVLNLALPHLSEALKPGSTQLLWIVDIYGFFVAGFLITMGNLGDRIGRRRLLLIGAAVFGIASIIAAFSNSAEMLIITRALMGVAGATLAPSTLSLIRNMFHDEHQRTTAFGIWIASYSVGGAIGPVVGGTLLEYFWWGSVLLIGVPVMILLLVVGPFLLPEYKDPRPGRLDIVSAFLSMIAVLSVIYGLKQLAAGGPLIWAIVSIIAGILFGIIFIQRQKKIPEPLIDVRLFRVPTFSISLIVYTLGTFITFGTFFFVFQYLQLVKELSPMQAGLWTVPAFLAFIAGSMISAPLVRRFSKTNVIAGGLALAAVGFAMLTQVYASSAILLLITAEFILSFGTAFVYTLVTDIIVGAAPPERAGTASALSETSSELGGALGIAILGSIGTAIYLSRMGNKVPTLPDAIIVAKKLSPEQGQALLLSAKEAFTAGLQLAGLICAIISVILSVLIFIKLRKVAAAT